MNIKVLKYIVNKRFILLGSASRIKLGTLNETKFQCFLVNDIALDFNNQNPQLLLNCKFISDKTAVRNERPSI